MYLLSSGKICQDEVILSKKATDNYKIVVLKQGKGYGICGIDIRTNCRISFKYSFDLDKSLIIAEQQIKDFKKVVRLFKNQK